MTVTPAAVQSLAAHLPHPLWRLSLMAAVLAIYFWRLGAAGLMDPDEGRYAEMAREMLARGDWLLPHLNYVPYLEKPPLVTWLLAVSFGLFGLTECAARLPVALSAVAGVGWAYVLARRWWGEAAGLWAALVLATCGGYVTLGRLLTLDMTLALFLNLAVGLGYLAFEENRRGLLYPAYGALALAVLTKGPVALVLTGLIWGDISLLSARRPPGFWLHPGGLLVLAALTLPWFVWVSLICPEFPHFFFWEHHVGRFATEPIHEEPFFYYLPVLLVGLLPWTPLLPGAVLRLRAWEDPRGRVLLLWAGVILLFFSLSRGKLAPYILPALLPLALLVGRALAEGEEDPGLRAGIVLWLGLGLAAGILYLALPGAWAREVAKTPGLRESLPLPIAAAVLSGAAALLGRRRWPLALGALALALSATLILGMISTYRSPREAALAAAARVSPETPVVGLRFYSQALSFYLRRPLHLFEVRGELEFGLELAPESGFELRSREELAAWVRMQPQVLFLVPRRAAPRLREELPGSWEELGRYKDCLLLAYAGK